MSDKLMSKREVLQRTKGLKGEPLYAAACALIGHSLIVSGCFGYIYCGRCHAQIADKLGGFGFSKAPDCVQIGHNCKTCRANYKKLDWRHKWLVPNPFKKAD